jgi:gag-polypeptide of LTR copia-type
MSIESELKTLRCFEGQVERWPLFKAQFEAHLMGRELHYVLTTYKPTLLKGASTPIEETQAKQWEVDNQKVRSLLMIKVNESTAMHIMFLTTAKAMWEKLSARFDGQSGSNKLRKLNALMELTYRGGHKARDHVGQMSMLISELKMSGQFNWDDLHVLFLLRSMPQNPDWAATIASLKTRNQGELTVDETVSILIERDDELQKNKTTPATREPRHAENAFIATSKSGKCSNCKKIGHTRERCWQVGGGQAGQGPIQSRGGARNPQRVNAAATLMTSANVGRPGLIFEDRWIFDSAAPTR